MRVRPDYYEKFHCIADACPITCCQEWKIAVDDDTNRRWKKILPPDTVPWQKKNLSAYTCKKEGIRVIGLDEGHRCPFLAEDKLCRLVSAYGDGVLSETCTTFPREVHRFSDHEEETLMPCCPAVVDLWRENPVAFPSINGVDETAWKNTQKNGDAVEKRLAFLIRERILALFDAPGVSMEEALLESFYILLELQKNAPVTQTMVDEYFSADTLQKLRSAIAGAKAAIPPLATWEECNELLQDLAVNYRREGLYEPFLTPVITQAEADSARMDDAETLLKQWETFQDAYGAYAVLLCNFLKNEVFSDLIVPDADDLLEHMVMQMQWIAIEYTAIRQSLFLCWKMGQPLSYAVVRDYMVIISRMTGYEEDDIREYLTNSFAELIWEWGYFALIV